MKNWKVAALSAVVALTACADDVEDIDRTQVDVLTKADFDGTWYMRDTLTDVPATIAGPFVGIASSMEKIRWEITYHYLVAYRAHELVPGLDEKAGEIVDGETQVKDGFGQGINPDEFKGTPIAAYPITSHFDIQRGYNASTGEQTNVISENTSDREWHERKYMRVNWADNRITQDYPDFIVDQAEFGYYLGESDGTADVFYEERETIGDRQNALKYFDFTTRLSLAGDEMEVVTSFARLDEAERDYEPAFYDDKMMTKFGYFRTERRVYDRQLGETDSQVIYLANRHDLWENDYQRDSEGNYLRDEDGRRLPTPMAERIPKPVVYYLNPNFPEGLLTDQGVYGVAKDFADAFNRAAGAPLGLTAAQVKEQHGDMFLLCHNPVRDTDAAQCDPRSDEFKTSLIEEHGSLPAFEAREGDVRRSFIWWVHQDQASGPLGYGPSYPDRETGELISGTAYVYGAAVDRSAASGVDIVRLANGSLTAEQAREGDGRVAQALANIGKLDPRGSYKDLPAEILNMQLEDSHEFLLNDHANFVLDQLETVEGREELRTNVLHDKRRHDALKESGLLELTIDDEYVRGVSNGQLNPADMVDGDFEKMLEEHHPGDLMRTGIRDIERQNEMAEHTVYLEEFADSAVMATAREFIGQDDYDEIWSQIRQRLFRGVMAHEVGHTVGLRHNFQGSWDSANYFDEYWEMRKENFRYPSTINDLYEVSELTDAQIDGGMVEYAYSSIMDYHSRFNGDFRGLGKYDDAAILFAYTFGTYDKVETSNTEPINQEPGFVEIYNSVPETSSNPAVGNLDVHGFFHSYDDRYAASQHPLNALHYTLVIDLLGGPDALTDRSVVRYAPLREQQENNDPSRPVEVQYMFGSDEWAEATVSASRWDLGADPFEKVKYEVAKFNDYYPLTHFRRDRANFWVGSAINRSIRTFQMMPNVYQRWLFDQRGDTAKQNYFLFAALAGLNFLGDVLTKPEYGAYQEDDGGNYQLTSLDPDADGADLRVYPGDGRALFSSYDYGEGYYYFTRITEVGNYWNQIFALQTLAASTQAFVLDGGTQDARTYSLPYYLVFPDQVTDLFNGFFLDEASLIAPTAMTSKEVRSRTVAPVSGGGEAFDPLTGATIPEEGSEPFISPRVSFTVRIQAMLYGMFFFTSSYSTDYVNQGRIFKLGNGDQVLPASVLCEQLGLTDGCSNGTHELVHFSDPSTGIGYGAVRPVGGSETPGIAETLIARGQAQHVILNSPASTDTQRQNAARELANIVEDAVMVEQIAKEADRVL